MLQLQDRPYPLAQWASELLAGIRTVSEYLDQDQPEPLYTRALTYPTAVIHDPEQSLSARLLAEMHVHQESYSTLVKRYGRQHQAHFKKHPLPTALQKQCEKESRDSQQKQKALEAEDILPFDEYLHQYCAQDD